MSKARFYTADDLGEMDKDKLVTIAEARCLEVAGTGTDGNVLVEDLTGAITADQDASGVNPALAPQPDVQVSKRYRVTAPTRVYDTAPGEEFDAVIPAERERMLVEGGAIVVVEPAPPVSPTAPAKAAATSRDAATPRPKEKK